MKWFGWTDDLAGLRLYELEFYKLEPDSYGRLTEGGKDGRVKPVHTMNVSRVPTIEFPQYEPDYPGMYSVLLRVADYANNFKIARRFVLYDRTSDIDLLNSTSGGGDLFASSAVAETGYMWQTVGKGSSQTVTINWKRHFVNKVHNTGKFLNEILDYPPQFQDLEDYGILLSGKFVYPGFDDNEGSRTKESIKNFHGIVRFEVCEVYTEDTKEPTGNWKEVAPSNESYEFNAELGYGGKVRVWVRAHDIIGNTRTDSTVVYFDRTDPVVNRPKVIENQANGTFTYTTRLTFKAVDVDSGVHKIRVKVIIIETNDERKVEYYSANNRSVQCDIDTDCRCVLGQCFIAEQQVDLNNCWFIVDKDELRNRTARVDVTVYNQALREKNFSFKIKRLYELHGLEEYSGPTNIRVLKKIPNGVRLAWDLPESSSCYGRADIYIIVYKGSVPEEFFVHRETKTYDIIGLDPETDYKLSIGLQLDDQKVGTIPFSFKTDAKESPLTAAVIADIVAETEKTMLTLLEEIRSQNSNITKGISQILQSLSQNDETEQVLPDISFPIKSTAELQQLGQSVTNEDTRKLVIRHLAVVGCNSVKQCTRRIMKLLMTNDLAAKYNWKGKGDKVAFSATEIRKLIPVAVRKNRLTQNATDAEVNNSVKAWLRFAKDRGGRRKRETK